MMRDFFGDRPSKFRISRITSACFHRYPSQYAFHPDSTAADSISLFAQPGQRASGFLNF